MRYIHNLISHLSSVFFLKLPPFKCKKGPFAVGVNARALGLSNFEHLLPELPQFLLSVLFLESLLQTRVHEALGPVDRILGPLSRRHVPVGQVGLVVSQCIGGKLLAFQHIPLSAELTVFGLQRLQDACF